MGALGKIGFKFEPQLIPEWLGWLPFQSDPEEARAAHELFVQNFELLKQWNIQGICQSLLKSPDSHVATTSKNKLITLSNYPELMQIKSIMNTAEIIQDCSKGDEYF